MTTVKGAPRRRTNKAVAELPPPSRSQAALVEKCTTDLCGRDADDLDETDPYLKGWIRAGVYGSVEPDRLWCSWRCMAIGVAYAQLRMKR